MNIREMRAQLGDTQSEFSARYHIPFRTVQNWETGMRKPPEYVSDLLEQRIKEDLTNRKTLSLPKYDPQKKDLPSRSSYVGALSWLQAVRDCIGEPVVFALDNALMCQGNFGGRSDEYIVWVYGDGHPGTLRLWQFHGYPESDGFLPPALHPRLCGSLPHTPAVLNIQASCMQTITGQ